MALSVILFFISNALVQGDKSIYITRVIINSLFVCIANINVLFNFQAISNLVILLIYIGLPLISFLLICKVGLKRGITIHVYIYYLLKFTTVYIPTTNSNYIIFILLVATSIVTFMQIYKNTIPKTSKPSLSSVFFSFLFAPTQVLIIMFWSLIITRWIRLFLINLLGLTNIDYTCYMFVTFSVIIPTMVLCRIIYNVLLEKFFFHRDDPLSHITFEQVFNYENYVLHNITLANTIIILYVSVPFLCLGYEVVNLHTDFFQHYRDSNFSRYTTNESLYSSHSCEDLSHPASLLSNHIDLNLYLSKRHDKLLSEGATPIETLIHSNPSRLNQISVLDSLPEYVDFNRSVGNSDRISVLDCLPENVDFNPSVGNSDRIYVLDSLPKNVDFSRSVGNLERISVLNHYSQARLYVTPSLEQTTEFRDLHNRLFPPVICTDSLELDSIPFPGYMEILTWAKEELDWFVLRQIFHEKALLHCDNQSFSKMPVSGNNYIGLGLKSQNLEYSHMWRFYNIQSKFIHYTLNHFTWKGPPVDFSSTDLTLNTLISDTENINVNVDYLKSIVASEKVPSRINSLGHTSLLSDKYNVLDQRINSPFGSTYSNFLRLRQATSETRANWQAMNTREEAQGLELIVSSTSPKLAEYTVIFKNQVNPS